MSRTANGMEFCTGWCSKESYCGQGEHYMETEETHDCTGCLLGNATLGGPALPLPPRVYIMEPVFDELACSAPDGMDSEIGCRAGSGEGGVELTLRAHGREFCGSYCSVGRLCGEGGAPRRAPAHHLARCRPAPPRDAARPRHTEAARGRRLLLQHTGSGAEAALRHRPASRRWSRGGQCRGWRSSVRGAIWRLASLASLSTHDQQQ